MNPLKLGVPLLLAAVATMSPAAATESITARGFHPVWPGNGSTLAYSISNTFLYNTGASAATIMSDIPASSALTTVTFTAYVKSNGSSLICIFYRTNLSTFSQTSTSASTSSSSNTTLTGILSGGSLPSGHGIMCQLPPMGSIAAGVYGATLQ
jgi:hypothetical protein